MRCREQLSHRPFRSSLTLVSARTHLGVLKGNGGVYVLLFTDARVPGRGSPPGLSLAPRGDGLAARSGIPSAEKRHGTGLSAHETSPHPRTTGPI